MLNKKSVMNLRMIKMRSMSWGISTGALTANICLAVALVIIGVNIQMISTSEIKISVLIDEKDADRAVSAVHQAFLPEE